MFEFAHPGFLAGAALVSAPILIHLINRMRYQRVRWPAMEFLLQSQKRNQRRLLIEQLLLLAMRCLLVLLVVLLVARFRLAFDFNQPQSTVHVVLLDDSLSMTDRWPDRNEKGGQTDCFAVGKRLIAEDIARNAVRSGAAQRLALVYLSRPDATAFNERLNEQSIRELEAELGRAECKLLHLDLAAGMAAAADPSKPNVIPTLLGEATAADPQAPDVTRYLLLIPLLLLGLGVMCGLCLWAAHAASRPVAVVLITLCAVVGLGLMTFALARAVGPGESSGALTRHVLHVVTDLRQRDWGDPGSARLAELIARYSDPKRNVRVNLIDTATPARRTADGDPTGNVPPAHANLALVDFRPETRVTATLAPVQFAVAVANYGPAERSNVRVTFKVNGGQRLESLTFPKLAPGRREEKTFLLNFQTPGFNQVSANLDPEPEGEGLTADNTRYAVVKVVERVPLLLIDGSPERGRQPGGDTFQLQALFNKDVFKGFDLQRGGPRDLEKADLGQYASIYLLNVREFSDPAVANLQRYVRDGGSAAFFLGDKVDPEHYTAKLYRKGEGMFPAPLDRPVLPVTDPQERNKLREDLLNDGQPKLFFRKPDHQVVAAVSKYASLFTLLLVEGYFPVPRTSWPPRPGPDSPGQVEELASLPNTRQVREFAGQARDLLKEIQAEEGKDPAVTARLRFHREAVEEALRDKPLPELARAFEEMLRDAGEPKTPDRPDLTAFWAGPALRGLRDRLDRFRETVQYGDPLIVARTFGKGRVVAFLTTAGQGWNNWSSGGPVMLTYPILIGELQKYLTGVGDEARLLGEAVPFDRDGKRLSGAWRSRGFPEAAGEGKPADLAPGDDSNLDPPVDRFAQRTGEEGDRTRLRYTLDQIRKPGVYLLDLAPADAADDAAKPKPERLAVVFNVDTAAESDLQRASRTKLDEVALGGGASGRVRVVAAGSSVFKELAQRQADLSESPWLFLGFLAVLVLEQALAVHLSFNLAGKQVTVPGGPRRGPAA